MNFGCCCGDDCLEAITETLNFDSSDKWSIKTDVDSTKNEIGAGYLYKRAKSKPIWSRRFCTLTKTSLVYYKDNDRTEVKGTIVVAGAVAQISPNRINAKDKKYFILSHPHCGMREFYANTNTQRDQWIETLNSLSNSLKKTAYYGKLKKLGSTSSSSSSVSSLWKKRWCICVGDTLDYFEHARDNQAKGYIYLIQATVRELSHQDEKFCFEIIVNSNPSTSQPMKSNSRSMEQSESFLAKRHVFAAENEGDRRRWMEVITRICSLTNATASNGHPSNSSTNSNSDSENITNNPILAASATTSTNYSNNSVGVLSYSTNTATAVAGADAITGVQSPATEPKVLSSATSIPPTVAPSELTGYLKKKSPSDTKGFQSRYFILRHPGEITYFLTEEEALEGMKDPKGLITLIPSKTLSADSSIVEYDSQGMPPEEFIIHTLKRSYVMQADSVETAKKWVRAIELWTAYRAATVTTD